MHNVLSTTKLMLGVHSSYFIVYSSSFIIPFNVAAAGWALNGIDG